MTIVVAILLVFTALALGVLAFAWTRPDALSVQRVIEINAPPERIFALIDDFRHWPAWAPQDKMDATMKRTFGEKASGQGASSEWVSRGHAGCGRMEITESVPPTTITVKVDFAKPFVACNIHQFTLEPVAGSTRVTWALRGTNPFIAKVMAVFFSMEKMFGKHFESGLQSLKALAEQ